MILHEPIGGFFELAIPFVQKYPYSDSILLSSGRACFEYILVANNAEHVYIPKFTCDVILEPLRRLSIPYTFYSINEKLEIVEDINLSTGEYILYTNYFGVKDRYATYMVEKYGDKLILDCSQAFYYRPVNAHFFYSPRKFFGVPDGGSLYTNKLISRILPKDISYKRSGHLLKRIDLGPERAYQDFKHNDSTINNMPIAEMSLITRRLLDSIDYKIAREARIQNYNTLRSSIHRSNEALFIDQDSECPMYFPLLLTDAKGLKHKLIEERVFVPTYWPNVLDWTEKGELENYMTENIIPLPIDQRYSTVDMLRIARIVNEYKD